MLKYSNHELISNIFLWLLGKKHDVGALSSRISDYKFQCDVESLSVVRLLTPDVVSPLRHGVEIKPPCSNSEDIILRVARGFKYLGLSFSDQIIKPKPVLCFPKLIPAVHPPSFYPIVKLPDVPLLDLDDLLADPKLRLNRIAYDSSESDVFAFVDKARRILSPETSDVKEFLIKIILKLI